MRATRLLPLFLLAGCARSADPLEARVSDLLAKMTLDEKIDQMHGASVDVFDGTYHTPDNARLHLPGFRMIDGPSGIGAYAGHGTAFPTSSARGATFDPDLETKVGRAIAEEARARGANVLLAPCINILRHPRWGRAQETYGEDSHHLGRMGEAFIRGAQTVLIASAKHFAANSIENDRFTVDVKMDERTLREVYLPHFKRAVDAGVGSVMSAYNKVNGQYCAENDHLLREILKGEWGFSGFVESDWVFGTRSTIPSARAGLDIEMPGAIYYGDDLKKAVMGGAVLSATLDDHVRRILRTKIRFGIADGLPEQDPAVVESADHVALARQVAREAIVLLKNEGGALPLVRERIRRIAVVGPLAGMANLGDTGGSGSSKVMPSSAVTPLDGIRAKAGAIAIDAVATSTLTAADLARIHAADAAIVVAGLSGKDEGENTLQGIGDRRSMLLSSDQEAMIRDVAASNPRTIVVLEGSGAIVMENWVDQVAGLLMAWYPGMEGGAAIAEVIFGEVVPSGKLPVSFPRSEDQLPPFINDQPEIEYGYYHGYRHLDRQNAEPRFPFGFGKSYTTFAYANLTVDPQVIDPAQEVTVSADVTNTGTVAADEVAQLYAGFSGSKVDRPVRVLAGFGRVHLSPGATGRVRFTVAAADLAYYDAAAKAWVVEALDYRLELGPSSRTLPLVGKFTVRR